VLDNTVMRPNSSAYEPGAMRLDCLSHGWMKRSPMPRWCSSASAEASIADLAPIEPYLHLGVGFTYWDANGYRGVHDDDTQFLLSMGFGVEYRFDKHVSVGSQMLFNVIPVGILEHPRINDKFYYSWQVIGLRYRI